VAAGCSVPAQAVKFVNCAGLVLIESAEKEKFCLESDKYQFFAAFLHFLLRCAGTLFIVSRVCGPGSGLHEGSNDNER
jgi:hypothetical protein